MTKIEEEFERNMKEFRKGLRYAYRHYALNSYGKKISELTTQEKRKILDWVLKEDWKLYGNRYGNLYKEFFKEVFKKELMEIK